MNKALKMLASGVGVTALACALAIGPAASADAALSCSGSQVSAPVLRNDSGTVVGRMGVYVDGTTVCAVIVKQGPVYGTPTPMFLGLYTNGYDRILVNDSGSFSYQTNAISWNTRNTASGCINVYGQMENTRWVDRVEARVCR